LRRKLERGQSMEQILRVSAAPGYSEHHSGRALDITASGFRALEEEFENSPAFAWLKKNSRRFGFHLSYPRRNRHGIAYEPWHYCWHAKR
ncbi:MAG: D-alanyl-D-alanine carboxypeptidase family protein, partial [Rudaea sp.]